MTQLITLSKAQARTGAETETFPQWNRAVHCGVRSGRPQQICMQCGAEVDGDGDNDCTLSAMTLGPGTLRGWLHI